MKSGMAPGLDIFPVEYVKISGMMVVKWLGRLLNISVDIEAG